MQVVEHVGRVEFVPERNIRELKGLPAVSVYEVFRVLLREAGEEAAIQGVAAMQRGRIIDLTVRRALDAAALSLRHSLPWLKASSLRRPESTAPLS